MGSPQDEPERHDRETQHEVEISTGFWMADTACTQELWQVVCGENPSDCRGAERPVDSVSWDDVMDFFQRLGKMAPGLNPRLPTEAEWEYACRAGTTTAFAFGDQVTTEQVNYNGNHPYHEGGKGEFRGATVPVLVLPANQWGLYQMHGNVWEWCNDWYGAHEAQSVRDPQGPDEGEERVLCGGCWFDYGGAVRSAYRNAYDPSYRDHGIGFRFSLGHS